MGFEDVMNKQNKASLMQKIADNTKTKKTYKDERFWELTLDSKQNGEAIIRFLPCLSEEQDKRLLLVRKFFIRKNSSYFIEPCPSNIGEKSYGSEMVSKLWDAYNNTGNELYKELAKERSSSLKYVTNIYVVKDPAKPENEGKVFLFEFGKKILDKILEVMPVKLEESSSSSLAESLGEDEKYDPADFLDGANFFLHCSSSSGKPINRSFDKSKFLKRSPLSESEAELREIYNKQFSLNDYIHSLNYSSYNEFKQKWDDFFGDTQQILAVLNGEDNEFSEADTKKSTKYGSKNTESETQYSVDADISTDQDDDLPFDEDDDIDLDDLIDDDDESF